MTLRAAMGDESLAGKARLADSGGVALRPRWVAALLLGAFLLCYASVIVTPYAMTDDYYHLANAKRGQLLSSPAEPGMPSIMAGVASGRFTSALTVAVAYHLCDNVASLRYLRLFTVVATALLAFLIYCALARAGFGAGESLAVAFLICTTPPFQCYAGWSLFFNAMPSPILAALSHRQIQRALDEPAKRWLRAGLSVLLLFLAGTIYQVTMMFFVLFSAIDVFRPKLPLRELVRRACWQAGVLGVALALGFIAFKICISQWGEWMDLTRMEMVSDLPAKLTYFVLGPLSDALHLWKLWPSDLLPVVIGTLLPVGLFLYFEGRVLDRLARVALALLLIPGIYLPNLVTAENWGAYRTQFALTSLIVLYAFFAVRGFARLARGWGAWVLSRLLPAAALLAAISAVSNVHQYFVDPQVTELRVVESQLARVDLSQLKKIYVQGASWLSGVVDVRYDEFGVPSTSKPWSDTSMVFVLASERVHGQRIPPIERAPSPLPALPTGIYVVNLTRLDLFR